MKVNTKIIEDIQIATVKKCGYCDGFGYRNKHGWDTCTYCGGTGKVLDVPISISELKKSLRNSK
jgi:DnaJ-class molecular chaperone